MHEVFRLLATIKTNGKAAVKDFRDVEKAGYRTTKGLQKAFKGFLKIIKGVFVVAAAAATYFFVSSIKSAAKYEAGMANVKAVTGATGKEFEALNKKAKQLGKDTKFTMISISEGMEALGRAGMTANEIIDSMAGVTALAASQSIELGQAAEMTAGALNGFNLAADQAGRVADVYTYAASNSAIRTEDLAETLKYAMPAANALGYSLEDVAGMAMILGDNMIKGSMAGTGLSFAFSELVGMSDEFQKKLGDVGVSVDDLTGPDGKILSMAEILGVLKKKGLDAGDMFELFGKRAGKSMVILLDKGETAIKDYTGALEECGGTAEEMAEIQLNTLSGQLEILKGSWELLKVTVGEKLMPILKDFVKGTLIPLVNRMAEAAGESDTLKEKFEALIEGVKSGIEWVIDNRRALVTAIEAIGAALLIAMAVAHPIIALVAALTALGLIIATTGTQAGEAKKKLETFGEELNYLIDTLGPTGKGIMLSLKALNQFIDGYITALGKAIGKMVEAGTVGKDAFSSIAVELAQLRDQMGTLEPDEIADAWVLGVDAILSEYAGMYPELEKLRVDYLDKEAEAAAELERIRVKEAQEDEALAAARAIWAATRAQDSQKVAGAIVEADKAVGESTQKLLDKYDELHWALQGSEKGTIEYADAVKDLRKLYGELGEYQDFFVENNMEVDSSITDLIAKLEELLDIKTGWAAVWEHMAKSVGKFCEDVKSLLTSHLGKTLIAWSNMRKENEQAAKEHEETLKDIHQDYADRTTEIDEDRVKRLKEINEGEAESLEDLRDDYEENLADIRDISDKMADLQGDRLKGLAKQEQSYVDKIADLEQGLQRSRLNDEERFQDAREDTTIDYNRAIEDENTRYGRQLADLEEEIAKASGDRLENLLNRKEELTEDHGERLVDIELRKTRRLEDIQTDAERAEEARVQEEVWRREEIEEDHKDRLEGIEERYTERVTELYEERDAKLEKAEQDFQNRRTEIVADARKDREKIEEDYNTALAEAHADEKARLDQEATNYEDQRKTVWGILKQGVRDFLSALKEKLLLKAAEEGVFAAAAALLLNFVGAAKHTLAAATYLAGGMGLAIAGFKEGILALGPVAGVIGEGPVPEVALPLTPPILADIGKGIVSALHGVEPAYAGAGIGGAQVVIEEMHVAEGAVFHVREEADIERIAKELGDEFDDRIIGKGRVTP